MLRTVALCLLLICVSCTEDTKPETEPQPPKATPEVTTGSDVVVPVDTTAPTWPNGATLTASKVIDDEVTLIWPPATDDRAILAYRIYRNEAQITQVMGGQLSATLTALEPAVARPIPRPQASRM